jgi:hypothetical protein
VTLEVVSGLFGDFNDDGSVDAADYVVWWKKNGSLPQYDEWRSHFGLPAGSGSGSAEAAVPEPVGALLLVLAAAFGICQGRRVPS